MEVRRIETSSGRIPAYARPTIIDLVCAPRGNHFVARCRQFLGLVPPLTGESYKILYPAELQRFFVNLFMELILYLLSYDRNMHENIYHSTVRILL